MGVCFMLTTFDFLLTAQRNPAFRAQLLHALSSPSPCTLQTELHTLTFSPTSQTATITPRPDTDAFGISKVVPKQITYQAFNHMLHHQWDCIAPDDITDLPVPNENV